MTDPIKALADAAREVLDYAKRSSIGAGDWVEATLSDALAVYDAAQVPPSDVAPPFLMKTPRDWINSVRRPHPDPDCVYINGLFDEDQLAAIQNDALESAARLFDSINPDASGGSMGAIIRFRDKIRGLKTPAKEPTP